MIEAHIEEFAGLRVRDDVLAKGIVTPQTTAYRVAIDYEDAEASKIRLVDVLAQFLADANVGSVSKLVIGQWDFDSRGTSADVLEMLVSARDKLPNLTGLFLGDIIQSEQEISWIRHENLSSVWAAFPRLEQFQVRGGDGLRLGRIKHDALRSLVIETGGLSPEVVAEVARASLPALEHLELWLGSDWYGGTATVEDLRPFLATGLFPKLKTLALRNFRFADDLAQALSDAPVLQQIDTLDLSLGTLGDDGARALLQSPHIRRLKKLDVHHHYMSREMMAALRQLPMKVDVSDEREPEDDEGERYVAISE